MEQQLRNSLVLLRLPFSFFLMPTFFFAWSQCNSANTKHLLLVFLIMHLLVYPASNGYNSYMDQDSSSIGGIENPPPPSNQLFRITVAMDITAILLSLLVNLYFTAGILIYIACSRAYSYRGIRLKKYGIAGFLTVFIVQGALTYFTIFRGIAASINEQPSYACMLASSLLIGALYPLTQIYQHEQDKADGVISISYQLGFKGTFIFSGILFAAANIVLFVYFKKENLLVSFFLFTLALLPAVAYFFYWAIRVFNNAKAANFRSSLIMNIVAAICTNTAFILLTIINH